MTKQKAPDKLRSARLVTMVTPGERELIYWIGENTSFSQSNFIRKVIVSVAKGVQNDVEASGKSANTMLFKRLIEIGKP